MYTEERERFTLRDVILQISFVVLFVFLLLWLFPTRNYVEKVVKPIDQAIFNENVKTMSEAAKNYFTLSRLPEKVGDKTKITLKDMLDKKLVLPFAGKESESCDTSKSYVEVTKLEDEYAMKVYLECGSEADYIIIHLGCYDYCKTTLCEVEKPTKPVVTPTKPVKVYEFEYKKTTGGYWTDWSAYSAWSKTRETTSDTKREDSEVRSEFSHYSEIKTGTYERTTLVGNDIVYTTKQTSTNLLEFTDEKIVNTQVISGYKTVGTGTYVRGSFVGTNKYLTRQTSNNQYEFVNERIGSEQYVSSYTTVSTGFVRTKDLGIKEYTSVKYNTSTMEYVSLGSRTALECSTSCTKVNYFSYRVYEGYMGSTSQPVYSSRTTYTYDVYNKVEATKQEPIYTTKTTYTYDVYNKQEIIRKEAVNVNVTYYRYQTRTYLNGTVSIKWSRSQTDKTLLDQGYKLTGNKREYKNSNV